MKRYMLFSGDNYYPGGGMYDYKGSYDTVKEAVLHIVGDWAHVYDNETEKQLDAPILYGAAELKAWAKRCDKKGKQMMEGAET